MLSCPRYTFGLPHALGTSKIKNMLVVRNVKEFYSELYLDFFDVPIARLSNDNNSNSSSSSSSSGDSSSAAGMVLVEMKRSKARLFFEDPRDAGLVARCIRELVIVPSRQRNVLRLRYRLLEDQTRIDDGER